MSVRYSMKFTTSTDNRSIIAPTLQIKKVGQKSSQKSSQKSVSRVVQVNAFQLYRAPTQNVLFNKSSAKKGCGCGCG